MPTPDSSAWAGDHSSLWRCIASRPQEAGRNSMGVVKTHCSAAKGMQTPRLVNELDCDIESPVGAPSRRELDRPPSAGPVTQRILRVQLDPQCLPRRQCFEPHLRGALAASLRQPWRLPRRHHDRHGVAHRSLALGGLHQHIVAGRREVAGVVAGRVGGPIHEIRRDLPPQGAGLPNCLRESALRVRSAAGVFRCQLRFTRADVSRTLAMRGAILARSPLSGDGVSQYLAPDGLGRFRVDIRADLEAARSLKSLLDASLSADCIVPLACALGPVVGARRPKTRPMQDSDLVMAVTRDTTLLATAGGVGGLRRDGHGASPSPLFCALRGPTKSCLPSLRCTGVSQTDAPGRMDRPRGPSQLMCAEECLPVSPLSDGPLDSGDETCVLLGRCKVGDLRRSNTLASTSWDQVRACRFRHLS